MSPASLLPAGRRFHSAASARPENAQPEITARASAARVAMLRADLLAIIVHSSRIPPRATPRRGTRNHREHCKQRNPGALAAALQDDSSSCLKMLDVSRARKKAAQHYHSRPPLLNTEDDEIA